MTESELEQLGKDAAEWVASPEGQAAIEEGLARARETTAALEEARKIPWWKMFEPFGHSPG